MNDHDRFKGTGIYSGFLALIVIAVGIVILAAQNTESVTLRFIGLELTTPLISILIGAALLGALVDEVVGWVWRRRRRRLLADRAELEARRAVAGTEKAPDTQADESPSDVIPTG